MIRYVDQLEQAEAELARQRAQLEDLVRERTAELEASTREVQLAARHWQTTFEAMREGVALLDGDHRIMRCNRALGALLGRHAAGLLGLAWTEVMPCAADGAACCPVVQAATRGQRATREFRWDGRWLEVAAEPLRDEAGAIGGFVLVVVDNTERKAIETALTASEERWRILVETLPDLVWLKDPEGKYLACNKRFEAFFGAPRAAIVGHTDHEFVDAGLAEFFRANDRAAMTAGGPRMNEERVTFANDGHCELLQTIKTPVYSETGELLGVLGVARDISAQKAAEEQLRKLSLTVEQSPGSVVITDLEGNIEYVNDAFEQVSGYSRDEVIGRNPRILQSGLTPPSTYRALWGALSRGEVWVGELVNRRKHGEVYVELATISPIRQPDGKVTHYVAMKQDITGQKRLAEELDRHRLHLEDLVRERTAELEQARAAAEAANRAKSAFLANMSHEIRTPMNAIVGLTHLLKSSAANVEQAQLLAKVEHSADHLLSIINDILDLSKIEADKIVLDPVDFHVESLLDNVASMVRQQAAEKGLSVRTEVHDGIAWLSGDMTRLRQALLNYAGNAVKFTERGGIVLRVRAAGGDRGRRLVRFEVEDTGIGIEQGRLKSLFEAFEQADASTTRVYGGTGLGLTITRRLAELMGGEVGASSEPGQGSVFWFTARLARGSEASARQAAPVDAAAGDAGIDARTRLQSRPGVRVLVVEDNAINREVMLRLLGEVGLEVETAANGHEALERLGEARYDLVLMDVQMPGMDGLEATRRIRRMPGTADLPVMAMTANVFEDDRRACRQAGMNDFVPKPVDPEALYAVLADWIGVDGEGDAATAPARARKRTPTTPHGLEVLRGVDGLDLDAGLRQLRGDAETYSRLLLQFVSSHGDDARRLAQMLADGAPEAARHWAHNLKGAAGNLGLVAVQAQAQRLEQCLGAAVEPPACAALIDALSATLLQLRARLGALPPQSGKGAPQRADSAEVAAVLHRLADLLAADDAAVNNAFAAAADLLRAAFGARADALGKCIFEFDYPCAREIVEALSATDSGAEPAAVFDPAPLAALVGDDVARRDDTLRRFVQQSRETLARLDRATADGELDEVRFLAHQLKTPARTVGAVALGNVCERLEQLAAAADRAAIGPTRATLATALAAFAERVLPADSDGDRGPA
jgi:PAS domain S-box-containing protein